MTRPCSRCGGEGRPGQPYCRDCATDAEAQRRARSIGAKAKTIKLLEQALIESYPLPKNQARSELRAHISAALLCARNYLFYQGKETKDGHSNRSS